MNRKLYFILLLLPMVAYVFFLKTIAIVGWNFYILIGLFFYYWSLHIARFLYLGFSLKKSIRLLITPFHQEWFSLFANDSLRKNNVH